MAGGSVGASQIACTHRRPKRGCLATPDGRKKGVWQPSVALRGLAVVGERMTLRASGRPILDDEPRYAPKVPTIAGHYGCSNFLGNRRDPQIVVLHVQFGADQRPELRPS